MQDREGPWQDQLRELERELERMHRELERMHRQPRGGGVSFSPPRGGVVASESSSRALGGYMVAMGSGKSKGGSDGCISSAGQGSGPIVVRRYELTKGKREALNELMVRSDVPIQVRPLDDGIEVHATEGQQCLFEAFCLMIGKDDTSKSYRLPEGKLEALGKLMVRSDVPIMVEPGTAHITVHGSQLEQEIFGAFVNMIHSDGARTGAGATKAYAEAIADLAEQYEDQAHAQVDQLHGLNAALKALHKHVTTIERQSDRLRDKADRMRDKADDVRDEADNLRDEAEELEGKKRESKLSRAEALLHKAEELAEQAEAIDEQASIMEEQAEAIEEQVEAVIEQIEEFEELADRGDD
jgi:hypothetical protein